MVQPDEFIHRIEGTFLSGTLTYWAIETVAKELGDWLRTHWEASIGINVPPELLGRGALEYAVEKTGLMPMMRQILIEVTERGIPDQMGVAALEAASKSGIRIALDDVTLTGTHLAVLSRCALDVIVLLTACFLDVPKLDNPIEGPGSIRHRNEPQEFVSFNPPRHPP